jgi:phenylacetate-CoA ligase
MTSFRSSYRNLRALRTVMRDAKRSAQESEELVSRRLRNVLVSAYKSVPYYRDIMRAANYDPARDYRGPSDLRRLSITAKADLRQAGLAATTECGSDLSQAYQETTSGSTGTPIVVYRSPDERAFQIAKWLRVLFVNGYSTRDRVMSYTAPARTEEGRSFVQSFGFFRREAVPYAVLSTAELTDRLLDYRPEILYGLRSHVELVALELRRRSVPPLRLKLLVVTGEVIRDCHRSLLCGQFGVEPVESYGSVEIGTMAYQTPGCQGLALCEDLVYYEFLAHDGTRASPGVPARIVVTDLTKTLQPFIRYDHGDLVIFERQRQGDGTSERRLTRIVGRDSDHALLSDGTPVSPNDLDEIMLEYPDINQFQVVQKAPGELRVLVVTDLGRFVQVRSDLIRRFRKRFADQLSIDVVRLDAIDPDASGKLRTVISERKP